MKRCPFCAEQIQDAAVVCRFCNRDIPASASEARAGAGGGVLPSGRRHSRTAWAASAVAIIVMGIVAATYALSGAFDTTRPPLPESKMDISIANGEMKITNTSDEDWFNVDAVVNERYHLALNAPIRSGETSSVLLGRFATTDGDRLNLFATKPQRVDLVVSSGTASNPPTTITATLVDK